MALVANALAHTTVQVLNGIRGVDHFAYRRGKSEERDDLRPVAPPALRDRQEALAPGTGLEFGERLFSRLHIVGLVNRLEGLGQRLGEKPGQIYFLGAQGKSAPK